MEQQINQAQRVGQNEEKLQHSDYSFFLRSLKYPKHPALSVDFSPYCYQINQPKSGSPKTIKGNILPAFNNDALYYTPGFMLQIDKIRTSDDLSFFLNEHQNAILRIEEKSQLLVAKPKKSPYCQCCRVQFDDFLEHMADSNHIARLRKNRFSKDIERLCKQFAKTHKKISKKTQKEGAKQVRGKKCSKEILSASTEIQIQLIKANQVQ